MSLEDEVSRKLNCMREKEEKDLQAEADGNAAEAKRREELSGSLREFASYLKKIKFLDLPLYIVKGRRGGVLIEEYSYYGYAGNGWAFTLDRYDEEYDSFICDQFLSVEGEVFQGAGLGLSPFNFCLPSKDLRRTGLPNSMHLAGRMSQIVESPLRVVEALVKKRSDIIAKIIHSRPGMPPGCEPGVLGYLGSY